MINIIVLIIFLTLTSKVFSHQPVMDMAPRWNDGYGVQTRIEHANSENKVWLEGVYTFKPMVRMTLKIPTIDGELDDAIIALPLKKYFNDKAFTSNWSITPSIRMPTGGGADWDAGLSLSYSSESSDIYQLYDLYALDDVIGLDINVGAVQASGEGSSWFALWDVSAQDSNTGQRILTGPVLVYFDYNFIIRAEYKFSALDNDRAWKGDYVSFGIGMVF